MQADPRRIIAETSESLEKYRESLWRAGWAKGYGDGWTAGRDAAVRQYRQVLADVETQRPPVVDPPTAPEKPE